MPSSPPLLPDTCSAVAMAAQKSVLERTCQVVAL